VLSGRQLTLLTVLVVNAGDAVSVDSLIDARWPTDGAGSVARKRLQMTVTRLRHALEPVAEVEIGRLDELRSVALEGRIEADVQLVRHAEVMSLALA
jgi:DNA-binding SARP family transcriptional activator